MRTIKLLSILMLVLLTTWSCDKDLSNDDDNNGNNLADGQIEMVIYPDTQGNITFYIKAKKIHIDWGDGQVEEFTPNGEKALTHNYTQKEWTIKINTEELTFFRDYVYYHPPTPAGIIEELKFGYCPRLYEIRCASKLASIDVSKCTALTFLDVPCYSNVHGNRLTSIDVSKCTALTHLNVSGNELAAIDASKCTALAVLNLRDNKLTAIDVSKCTVLATLDLRDNKLTAIDVSKCTALTGLNVSYNELTGPALNRIFNDLPNTNKTDYISLFIRGNPGADDCDKTIAEKKGWRIGFY